MSDYEFMRNHLAKIMMDAAYKDKKREPEQIAIYHLSWLMARKVIDFAINPRLEDYHTAAGHLYYAGVGEHQMTVNVYRLTWKPYENLMTIALEMAIKEASDAIERYRLNTYKDAEN